MGTFPTSRDNKFITGSEEGDAVLKYDPDSGYEYDTFYLGTKESPYGESNTKIEQLEQDIKRLKEVVQTIWDVYSIQSNLEPVNIFETEDWNDREDEEEYDDGPVVPPYSYMSDPGYICDTCYNFFGEDCEGCDNYNPNNPYWKEVCHEEKWVDGGCVGCQGEEELCFDDSCPDKLEPQVTKVTVQNEDNTDFVTITFPTMEAALEFTRLNS